MAPKSSWQMLDDKKMSNNQWRNFPREAVSFTRGVEISCVGILAKTASVQLIFYEIENYVYCSLDATVDGKRLDK